MSVAEQPQPPQILQLPPHEMLQILCKQLEAIVNKRGWGQDPILLTLQVDNQTVLMWEVPVELNEHPAVDLHGLVESLHDGDPETVQVFKKLIEDQTFGWMVCYEMLTNLEMTPMEQVTLNIPLEQHPATRRSRIVFGMDILGRVLHAVRQEGEPSRTMGVGNPILSGLLPATLRDLNILLAEKMPGKETYLKALADVEIMTTEDMENIAMSNSDNLRGFTESPIVVKFVDPR